VSGQRVIVTGGASGIGAEVVRQALDSGAFVAAIDLHQPTSDFAPSSAASSSPAALSSYACDVVDVSAVERTLAAIVEHWGAPPTALVHCAGIYGTTPTVSLSVEAWDQILTVNARGTFVMAQAAGRAMLAGTEGGSIVLLTSVASDRGDSVEPSLHYSASKGAVISMTRQLAAEWGPLGIRANAVSPGVIDTPMTTLTDHPLEAEAFLSRVPLRRLGLAGEVAATCLFLAGPHASYITGAVLPVDGGMLIS
jgi:NAD(P)-dependent dehydrogenase (short-subunit alcohol dehydrogenase family)